MPPLSISSMTDGISARYALVDAAPWPLPWSRKFAERSAADGSLTGGPPGTSRRSAEQRAAILGVEPAEVWWGRDHPCEQFGERREARRCHVYLQGFF